jgi:hypothetical protein
MKTVLATALALFGAASACAAATTEPSLVEIEQDCAAKTCIIERHAPHAIDGLLNSLRIIAARRR